MPNTLSNPRPAEQTNICPECGQSVSQQVLAAYGLMTLPYLRYERNACGLSQNRLAFLSETSQSQIYRIEHGQLVQRRVAWKIAQALGVTVDELTNHNTERGDA